MMNLRTLAPCLLAIALTTVPARPARADTPKEDPDALFEEGNKLMDAGRDAEACPLFERSLALDPSLGTRLNLAICYEKIGRLGSAHRLFREVEKVAHDTGKTKREEAAKEHLVALRNNASALEVKNADPSTELVVKVDGATIAKEDLAFLPLDPGEHVVEAIAARKKPFSTKITVAQPRGERHEVEVPVLEAEVVVQKKVESVVDTKRTVAYVAGGVGIAGVVTTIVTGVMISSAQSTADEHCTRVIPGSDKLGCDADGSSAVKRGETLLPINAIALGVGIVGLGVGTYLFLTSSSPKAPPAAASISPVIGPGSIGITGRF